MMMAANFGMCFTWPALEAMVSEGEPRHRMQSMVGIYNMTWAGAGAFAYFTGGAMIDHFGIRSMYLVPAALLIIQYFLALKLEREMRGVPTTPLPEQPTDTIAEKHDNAPAFLKMAWVANPFAYLGCNTVIALIPTLAHNLKLSAMMAGFVGSTWLFVRAASFVLLRVLAQLALQIRSTCCCIRRDDRRFRRYFVGAKPMGAYRRASSVRSSPRPNLLLVSLLLDGRRRSQRRTQRHPRRPPLAPVTAAAQRSRHWHFGYCHSTNPAVHGRSSVC